MILVILALAVIVMFIGRALGGFDDDIGGGFVVVGALTALFSVIVAIFLGVFVSAHSVIDNTIAMYQEENIKIEKQIATAVTQYQKHETEIFTDVAPESSITLVAMYPELKSDKLVQKQLEVYTQNTEKIKELKKSKINASVERWWLYFGN